MVVTINVDEIQPGMILASNVYDRRGRFLIGKNVALNPKHIKILKAWGVIEVNIEMEETEQADSMSGIDESFIKMAEEYEKKRFSGTDLKYEPIYELFRLCVRRKALTLSNIPLQKEKGEEKIPVYNSKPDASEPENPNLKSRLTDDFIRDVDLPSLPTIFHKITGVINNPRSSSKDIADIVSLDTSLSTRLLRIVNSAFYGFASKIDTISRAVVIVGTKQISALALGIQIINSFKNIPNELINMESFWKHSVACGIAARTLARYKNSSNAERLFIGGLLHDIGRLLIYKIVPMNAHEALCIARDKGKYLHDTEKSVLGMRHTEVGRNLLKKWKLPVSIENMVAFHHSPMTAPDPLEPAIINLADIIINGIEIGTSGEILIHRIEPSTWKVLGLSTSIYPTVIKQIDRQLAEIIRFFFHE